MTDLATLVRSGRSPPPAALRGLGDAWRLAETALLADISARPRRGLALADRFSKLARRCGEREAIGRADRLRGSARSHASRWKDAAAAYRAAIGRLDGAALDGARVGLAHALTRLGRFGDAVRQCRTARRAAEARGDTLLAAAARMNEAGALHEKGDATSALPLYRAACEAFTAAGRPQHAARAAEALANALVRLERFDEAVTLFDEAGAEYERAGLVREAATLRLNRAELLAAMDRLGEADAALDDAESALRAAGDAAGAALARLERGEVLLRARLVPEARHALASAARALASKGEPNERTRAALLLARAETLAGRPAAAIRLLSRPLPQETPALRALRTETLGRALAAEGEIVAARVLLERAAALHGADRPASRAGALAAAAWCVAQTGDAPAARRLAGDARRGAAAPSTRFAAAAALFLAEDSAGRRAAASRALRDALDALELVREGLGPDTFRAALLRGSEEWCDRALRHVLATEGADAALRLVERWRARALVDLLAAGDAALAPDAALAALRARLAVAERRTDPAALPAFLRSAAPPRAAARHVATLERTLRTAAERLPHAPFAAARDPAEALRALPPGTVVLSLHAGAGGGIALVADRGGVASHDGLAGAAEIAGLVEELDFRMGRFALGADYVARHAARLAAEADSVLARIAARTLGPVEERLRSAARLIVVPGGAWHRVPFAALPFGGGRLVESMEVVLAPSVAALGVAPPPATGAGLVLAAPDARAPEIASEGRRVAAAIAGARLVEGETATAAALPSRGAPSVLHVAAHGRFRDDAPALSAVRLADGWFRACELRRVPLRGATVVLSGCETGVASSGGGGESLGLVRAALSAGAREVVVSLWRVGDEPTASLMEDLHRRRRTGVSAAAALRAAQRARSAAGEHPWLWSGFAVWSAVARR